MSEKKGRVFRFNAICHVKHTEAKPRKDNPVFVDTEDHPDATCRTGICPVDKAPRASNPLSAEAAEIQPNKLSTYSDQIIFLLDAMVAEGRLPITCLKNLDKDEINVAYVSGVSVEIFVSEYAKKFKA